MRFDHFLKYLVFDQSPGQKRSSSAVFDVTQVQKKQPSCTGGMLPDMRTENNRKDQLYNALLDFLVKHDLSWREDQLHDGHIFIKALCDLLWYIDDHHNTFSRQGCAIPKVFKEFQNFNCPETHRHRKRIVANMSAGDLDAFSQSLF